MKTLTCIIILQIFVSSCFNIEKKEYVDGKSLTKLELYENKKHSFKVKYPSSWSVINNPHAVFSVKASKEDSNQVVTHSMSIIEAGSLSDNNLGSIVSRTIEAFEKDFSNVQVKTREDLVINNMHIKKIILAFQIDNIKLISQTYFYPFENKVYSVSFMSEEKSYPKLLPLYIEIANSFNKIN